MTQQEQQTTSAMMMENVFASKTLPEIVVTDVLQDSLSFHLAQVLFRKIETNDLSLINNLIIL